MRTIKLSLVLLLTFLTLPIQSMAQPEETGVLFHWATQNKVYLWTSPDDTTPTIATLTSNEWDPVASDELQAWQPIMRKVFKGYHPTVDADKFSDQQLWVFMLTKLRNEYTSVKWSKSRMPSAEVYVRKTDDKTVNVTFFWKEKQATKSESFVFNLVGQTWRKAGSIPLFEIFNLPETSKELLPVFDIPPDGSVPTRDQWPTIWDNWIKNFINSEEAVRPVMYRDQVNSLQWLWRERIEPDAKMPTAPRQMPPRPDTLPDPFQISTTTGGAVESSTLNWRAILISVTILAVIALALWLLKDQIKAWLHRFTGCPGVTNNQTRQALVSREGLEALNKLARERCLREPSMSNEHLKALVINSLDWVHQAYLAEMNSNEFLSASDELKAAILNDYKREIGVDQVDERLLKRHMSLGQISEEAVSQINQVQGLLYVRRVLKNQLNKEFLTDEEWLKHWPAVVNELDSLLISSQQDYAALSTQHEQKNGQHEKELQRREKEIKAGVESELKALRGNLQTQTDGFAAVSSKFIDAEKKIVDLRAQLTTESEEKELAVSAKKHFEDKAKEIQRVQNLSQDLRRLVHGYFSDQQTKDGELRSVGLVATLINFSLYQMCLSIMEDEADLKRAMAQNLFRSAQLFSQSSGYEAVHASLKHFDPRIESALDELRNLGNHAIDDRLFQAFLSKLKKDTGVNLGPFFIDLDEQKRITRVNAS